MNYSIRRKLDMADRAREFCRTHPDQNPGYSAATQRLEERLVRAEALARQQVTGHQISPAPPPVRLTVSRGNHANPCRSSRDRSSTLDSRTIL